MNQIEKAGIAARAIDEFANRLGVLEKFGVLSAIRVICSDPETTNDECREASMGLLEALGMLDDA